MNHEEIEQALKTWNEPNNEARLRFEEAMRKAEQDPDFIRMKKAIEDSTKITEVDLSLRFTI